MNERKTILLYNGITQLDESILEEAQQPLSRRSAHKPLWLRRCAAAACLALLLGLGARYLIGKEGSAEISSASSAAIRPPAAQASASSSTSSAAGSSSEATELPQLPLLTLPESGADGMGCCSAFLVRDPAELVSGNPWREASTPAALPVYENQNDPEKIDWEKMRTYLLEIAGRFGLDADSVTVTDDAPDEEMRKQITEKYRKAGTDVPDGCFDPTRLIVKTDAVRIEVDRFLTATIVFTPAVSLPGNLHFAFDSTYGQLLEAAKYLKNQYAGLLAFQSPSISISGGDYTLDSQHTQRYELSFCDGSGNETAQILQYNFYSVTFYPSDDGKLALIRIPYHDLSDKIGDYPIISADAAKELLRNGNYISTAPCAIPEEPSIAKTELIYRAGAGEKTYLPYYCFYVNISLPEEENAPGFQTYGAYYVPAVDPSYLTGLPVWNGSFNQ